MFSVFFKKEKEKKRDVIGVFLIFQNKKPFSEAYLGYFEKKKKIKIGNNA